MDFADCGELTRGAYIYLLRGRASDEYRYVGQTSGPRRRYHGHRAAARSYLRQLRVRVPRDVRENQLELELRLPAMTSFVNVRPPNEPTRLVEWLAKRIEHADALEMRVVERVACGGACKCWPGGPCGLVARRETFWIDYLARRGHRLFNRQRPFSDPRPSR